MRHTVLLVSNIKPLLETEVWEIVVELKSYTFKQKGKAYVNQIY